ncbi:HD domain-containing phosphohydrolase [Oribacterium sp. P6A1]|uniref:HD domain-containing phosphohydrolase n=1 Tax=Oribacterium sp. P6A1 TaxID=1410612 RepID=UPI000569E8C7|nr:HD domain-containing phosphohydrolase [Oribacterium sp. P6A1]
MNKPFFSLRKILISVSIILTAVIMLSFSAFSEELRTNHNESGNINRPLSVDPTGEAEDFTAVLYNNTNGLPTSEANAITETAEGFIWIGGYSGLIRYDGNTFLRLDSSTGVSSVTSLYVDKKNRLWIGTNDAGLAMMEHDNLHQWGESDGLNYLRVTSITEGSDGTIYVSAGSGLAMIDENLKLRYLDDPRVADSSVEALRNDEDGLIFGITDHSDIFTVKDGHILSFISHEDSGFSNLSYILPDIKNKSYVYLATDESKIYHFDLRGKGKILKEWDVSPIFSISSLEYIDGALWICAQNGIGKLCDDELKCVHNIPMNSSIEKMITDYSGNLWFTSSRQGVMKIVPNRFTDLFKRYGIPSSVVNTTCLYKDRLFMGSDTGLVVLDEKDGKILNSVNLTKAETASGIELQSKDLISLLSMKRIRSIIRDSKDRLWISTWNSEGLLRYDDGELMVFTEKDGLMSARIRAVSEKKDGSMLVVNTGGVSIIKGDKVVKNYDKETGITIPENLTVTEGFNGEILLGSNGGGVFIITDEETRNITTRDGLSSGIIMRIKRDDKRRVYWLVTSNSLTYITEDFEVHTIKDFPYSNNYDLYENSSGDMWVLSSNGIYVVSADELMGDEKPDTVFYGLDNGLPCISTANSYSELTDNGELYIASGETVVKVNINKNFENVSELKVAVPFVDADNRRFYPDENGVFNLPSDIQKLTINSFVYNYSLINPQVTYYLEGFDSYGRTVDRSSLVPVDYTNLRGGAYNFVIEIKDSMGRGTNAFSVKIVKEKAFYEQLWFYVISLIFITIVLCYLVQVYINQQMRALKKKNQETMTLIEEITEAFAKMIDMKDRYTNGHSSRVAHYTAMLSKELGYDDETVHKYYRIALLHDIGKIGVPSSVLNKSGKLTDEEFEIIKSHTTKGYEALKDISIMPELSVGAQAHHERPDGKGYPNHLKEGEIPRVAQIIAVADCFDAMYSKRPYRNRMNFDKVVSIIKDGSGTQLTSDVVDAFLRLVDKGEFRAPDDDGGGSTEDIVNIKK